jgi:5-(carboxyamino)imidazole ribonucleotide synthase
VNLFGEIWPSAAGAAPDFSAALRVPGVRLHLYGKRGARRGRKMGHLSAIGSTPAQALQVARDAAARVGAVTHAPPATLRALGFDA